MSTKAIGDVPDGREVYRQSLTFNLAGIFGASPAPYVATYLANTYGLAYVGYYLAGAAALTMLGLILTRETKDDRL